MLKLHQRGPFLASGLAGQLALVRGLSPAAWYRYGVGITVTGSGVSQWDDQSGNGRHLKQGTDTNRPAKQSDNSILFDGSDNYLKCDAFTLNQPETVYLLGRQVTWSINDRIWDGNANNSMGFTQNTATPTVAIRAANNVIAPNGDFAVNTYAVVVCVYNGASSLIQVNKNNATTGDIGSGNAGGFTLGAHADGSTTFSNIQVKEVIIYAAAHDATTRARIIRYLSIVGQLGI